MKKILIVITTAFHAYGGLSTVMLNYYRAMAKANMQIDFASTNSPETELLEELKTNGSIYYDLGNRKKKLFCYIKRLHKVLKAGNYDVIHVNGNSSTMFLELFLAKSNGVPIRIAHAHSGNTEYPMVNCLLNPLMRRELTHAIAVSNLTGRWLYKKNYIVLNDAIDIKHYGYNQEIRETFREKYDLAGKFVIGNVGKLTPLKNHSFLLKLFAAFHKEIGKSVLVVVGGGDMEKKLRAEARELGIRDDVVFTGMSNDVNDALQGFDAFVFPSIFEGLGLALIEAQASGLKCISSDAVPQETHVSDNIVYLNLTDSTEKWIAALKSIYELDHDRATVSIEACESIRQHGYDIFSEVQKLSAIYEY